MEGKGWVEKILEFSAAFFYNRQTIQYDLLMLFNSF
ncbi:hypothetical protein SMU76_08348 [Streptococcus mutans N66]|nr:hypothetical protein SMU76_08348 [Streptococcus mutans N66]